MSFSNSYSAMILVLAYSLISLMDVTYALSLDYNDHSLKNNIDFMDIEIGSKYSVGNKISDKIDDKNGVRTFDNLVFKKSKNIQEDINNNGMKINEDLLEFRNTKREENFQQFINGSEERPENSSTMNLNNLDPIRQIKLGIIKSLKHYIDKIEMNKTIVRMDNIEVSLIKESKILNDNTNPKNQTDEELDEQLIDFLWRAVHCHQINLGFANSNGNSKEGIYELFVTNEGRGKKKKGHHQDLIGSVAVAMSVAALLYLKMITMKAMFLSLVSLVISYGLKHGGGTAGRQIEAKYQSEALPAPVCACRCSGERNHLGTAGAYKFYNEHKNAYVTLDANGDEMDHLTAGTDYFPHQMSPKNSYLPPGGNPHFT